MRRHPPPAAPRPATRVAGLLRALIRLAAGAVAATWPALGADLYGGHDPAAPPQTRYCARLSELQSPLDVAAGLRDLPHQDRRHRLVAILRAELAARVQPVERVLRRHGGTIDLRLWSAGVICGTGRGAAWQNLATLPEVAAVFEDRAQADQQLDDAGGQPNGAVPPESPLTTLRVPEVWQQGLTGAGVIVALLDTGIDFAHADLSSAIWVNPGETAGNGLDDDGNGFIDDWRGWDFAANDNDPSDAAGHGTNVAGLIAGNGQSGRQTGVAPGAKLMVIRRGTTESSLWAGSQYAIENGADVLNQSVSWKWSFVPRPDYSAWRRQAESELAAGMLHVNSAGNTGDGLVDDPIPYNVAAPANCPPPWLDPAQAPQAGVSSVIAVGNVDARSSAIAQRSPYGPAEWTSITAHRDAGYPWPMPPEHQDYPTWNGEPGLIKPDLVAPGEFSFTTRLGGGYLQFDGTSAASPRVAGIAALLLQAQPAATPADLARALFTSARDLGPVGRDNRYGAGLVDAHAALDLLGPTVRVVSFSIADPGPPRGDGDGGADAGEIVNLSVTLRNTSSVALGSLELILTGSSPALVRDGFATVSSLGPGASITLTAAFTLELLTGSCGQSARLELSIGDGVRQRIESLLIPIGSETRTVLLQDDFELDRGFSTGGTATSGAWVRQVPVGTLKTGAPANPATDATVDPGSIAWVTGNGSTDPDAADVDGGRTTLTSPNRNTTGQLRIELDFARWFFGNDATGEDHFTIEASNNGSTWTLLEDVTAQDNLWRSRHLVLSDLLPPGNATRIRFALDDAIADDTVEAGLDEFLLTAVSLTCTPYTIPPITPSPVGQTLVISKLAGGHLRLNWAAPSAGGGIDPPRGYRITRSAVASSGFEEIGRPVGTLFTELGGAAGSSGTIRFYLVESLP